MRIADPGIMTSRDLYFYDIHKNMLHLITLFIFWIGIFLFRGLTKIQLSAIIAIIIWHENEALCAVHLKSCLL